VAQLGARLDGIEEVEGSNPFGSTIFSTAILCISNRGARLPPFLNAIRNFSVLCFQRLRPIFNYFHLRLEKAVISG
jgi:hypothetical protein